MTDKPTGVVTNGIGKVTTSHLNLTRSLADVEQAGEAKVTKWIADNLPRYGKLPYAGKAAEK